MIFLTHQFWRHKMSFFKNCEHEWVQKEQSNGDWTVTRWLECSKCGKVQNERTEPAEVDNMR